MKEKSHQLGFTLIELLVSMAILSVILLGLTQALDTSLQQLSTGIKRSNHQIELRSALEWLERDLKLAIIERPGNVPRLPPSIDSIQREFFGDKVIFPIEINRRDGDGETGSRSLANADPSFSQLVFVTRPSGENQLDQERDAIRLGLQSSDEVVGSRDAISKASIVGYYVAFTKDTPFAQDTRASMKLHRHMRSGSGKFSGDGYARGFLLRASQEINDGFDEFRPDDVRELDESNKATIRNGRFSNLDQPFLLFQRYDEEQSTAIDATAAWPALPLSLTSPPPTLTPDRATFEAWQDPDDPVHDIVFPDEPVAQNIVRFECKPYRIVEVSPGRFEVMDAAAINSYLELSGNDWPCLVAPDFIDVTLAVVGKTAATLLTDREDWIIDWDTPPSPEDLKRIAIEKDLTVHHLRIQLRTNSP